MLLLCSVLRDGKMKNEKKEMIGLATVITLVISTCILQHIDYRYTIFIPWYQKNMINYTVAAVVLPLHTHTHTIVIIY